MRATYTEWPEAVEVHTHELGTDVALRQNITEATDHETEQTIYICDEVQARFRYPVTTEEIGANFAEWWEIVATREPTSTPTVEEQIAQNRADIDYIAVMTGVDLEV